MSPRIVRTVFLSACLSLLLASPGIAQSASGAALPAGAAGAEGGKPMAAPSFLLFALGEGGELVPLSLDPGLPGLLKRFAPAESCNGGSCETGLGGVLSCPTSGGPTCGSSQPCGCLCLQMPNGSWSSANYCFSV